MKKLLLFISIVLVSFSDESSLVGRVVPSIEGVTLTGKNIDASYFQGKVTLLNFMYIGCRPCMRELIFLNELDSEMKGKPF
jgi:hypothetical protein